MKLIKYLPFASMLLALASCGSDEALYDVVKTNTPIAYSTGGTRFTGSEFEEGDAFAVYANYKSEEGTMPYITKQVVTLTDGEWKQDQNYYWPAENKLDFCAIYPVPDKYVNNIDFRMYPQPALYYHIPDFSKTVDLMVAATPDVQCPSTQAVPLRFKHVLSRMELVVTNDCFYGKPLDIHLDSLVVTAFMHNYGVLSWDAMSMQVVNEMPEEPFTYKVKDCDIEAEKTRVLGTFFFLPENVGDLAIKAVWRTINGGYAGTYSVSKKLPTAYELKAGKTTKVNIVLKRHNDDHSEGDVEVQ